jgi:hypothetical protein
MHLAVDPEPSASPSYGPSRIESSALSPVVGWQCTGVWREGVLTVAAMPGHSRDTIVTTPMAIKSVM